MLARNRTCIRLVIESRVSQRFCTTGGNVVVSAVSAVYEAVNKLFLENPEKKQALEWPINDVRRAAKAFSSPQIGGYVPEINSFTAS